MGGLNSAPDGWSFTRSIAETAPPVRRGSSKAGFVFTLAAAVACMAGAGAAHAGGLPILPDAISHEYFGLNFANNIVTRDTVGTLNYNNGPGCGGTCIATTSLGADPSVSLQVNEVVFQNTSGGGAIAELAYYVEYVNAAGTYGVDLHTSDTLSAPGGDSAQAYMAFGIAGPSFSSFNNFQQITFEQTDCVRVCSVANPAAFPLVTRLQMIANTPYLVHMRVVIFPTGTGGQSSASIDPMFTTDVLGGAFIFSPGVTAPPTGGVPEPASWALLLAGFGLAGVALRRSAANSRANRPSAHG